MQVLNIYLVFDAGNFQSSWEIITPYNCSSVEYSRKKYCLHQNRAMKNSGSHQGLTINSMIFEFVLG